MRGRAGVSALFAILGLVVVVVYGCGGSSSSSTGPSIGGGGGASGGSGGIVQGQILRNTAALGESGVVVVLEKALGIGVAEAAIDGTVPDGTVVKLVPTDPTQATLTTTTTGGNFTFNDVLPGEYTIQVVGFSTVLSSPATIVVGPGDLAQVTGTANKDTVIVTQVHVTAQVTDEPLVLQNPQQVSILIRLAKAAGVPADTVLAMRTQQHMGWGEIAHALGVHPSKIGGGQGPSAAEVDAFQASHGIGNGNGKGKGKGKA